MLFSYLALIICRTLSWEARHFLRSSVQFFPDPWLSNILRIGTQFKPRTDRFFYPYFLHTEKQLSQFLSAATFPIWHFKVLFLFSEAMKTPPTPFIFREVNLERCEFSHIHLALGLYDLINEHTKTSQVHEFGNIIPDEWRRPWTNNLKVMAGLLVARNVWRTDRNNIFGVKLKNPQNF